MPLLKITAFIYPRKSLLIAAGFLVIFSGFCTVLYMNLFFVNVLLLFVSLSVSENIPLTVNTVKFFFTFFYFFHDTCFTLNPIVASATILSST